MAVAKEPTLEEAHAGLMHLYALSGRESEALVQYERLREALSGHLGTESGTRAPCIRVEPLCTTSHQLLAFSKNKEAEG